MVKWTKESMEAIHVKIRKVLTMHRISIPSLILKDCKTAGKKVGLAKFYKAFSIYRH